MPSIITTKDLSVEDMSELKTGNTRRRHDMPAECVARHIAQGKSPEEAQRLCYKGNKVAPEGAAKSAVVPKRPGGSPAGIKKY